VTDWRKKFDRSEGAVWCDECLRWEIGSGRFDRVRVPVAVRALETLASAARWSGNKVARWLTDRAEARQVAANIKNGVFYARKP
jgi:hypothetical protein